MNSHSSTNRRSNASARPKRWRSSKRTRNSTPRWRAAWMSWLSDKGRPWRTARSIMPSGSDTASTCSAPSKTSRPSAPHREHSPPCSRTPDFTIRSADQFIVEAATESVRLDCLRAVGASAFSALIEQGQGRCDDPQGHRLVGSGDGVPRSRSFDVAVRRCEGCSQSHGHVVAP